MKAWAVLAGEVVKAEFPDFDVMLSMRVFDLSRGNSVDAAEWDHRMAVPVFVKHDLTRLAQTFQCDPKGLTDEWQDFRPRAMHHASRTCDTASNALAWVEAIRETHDFNHKATCTRHPSANLMAVLAPYMSISMSDSFLERSFSRADQVIGPQSRSMNETSEAYRMTILALTAEDIAMLYGRIQKLWSDHYPAARSGNFDRIDTGKKKEKMTPPKGPKPTETEFLQQKRKAVQAQVCAGVAATFHEADLPEGFHSTQCQL